MIEGIYQVAYSIWNTLVGLAMTLFTTSPTAAAGGNLYSVAHTIFNAISSISLPIATVFFLIAICRDVVMTPPDQQARRFVGDAIKFGIMIGILANLWDLMGVVIEIADGITGAIGSAGTYTLAISSDLQDVINEAATKPDLSISLLTFTDDLKAFFAGWFDYLMTNFLFLIASIATLIIIIASSISVLSSAFQRIIKPLVILPFSSITVAMGAGSGESSRVMTQYLKTFFGFCISGAFMVICIKLGVVLSTSLVIPTGSDIHQKVLFFSVQNAITPLIIAGLVKTADSVIARFF